MIVRAVGCYANTLPTYPYVLGTASLTYRRHISLSTRQDHALFVPYDGILKFPGVKSLLAVIETLEYGGRIGCCASGTSDDIKAGNEPIAL